MRHQGQGAATGELRQTPGRSRGRWSPAAQHPASSDVPSWRATRGTWETRSRGQSGARAGGFPGFKIHTEERAQAAAQPQYPRGRSRHSLKWGRVGAGAGSSCPLSIWAAPTQGALVLGVTCTELPVPICPPKTCLLASPWGNRTLAGSRAGDAAPARIWPLGERVPSTSEKQVLSLTARCGHLPGLGPCRIQLHSQQAASAAASPS